MLKRAQVLLCSGARAAGQRRGGGSPGSSDSGVPAGLQRGDGGGGGGGAAGVPPGGWLRLHLRRQAGDRGRAAGAGLVEKKHISLPPTPTPTHTHTMLPHAEPPTDLMPAEGRDDGSLLSRRLTNALLLRCVMHVGRSTSAWTLNFVVAAAINLEPFSNGDVLWMGRCC